MPKALAIKINPIPPKKSIKVQTLPSENILGTYAANAKQIWHLSIYYKLYYWVQKIQ